MGNTNKITRGSVDMFLFLKIIIGFLSAVMFGVLFYLLADLYRAINTHTSDKDRKDNLK